MSILNGEILWVHGLLTVHKGACAIVLLVLKSTSTSKKRLWRGSTRAGRLLQQPGL